MDIMPGEYKAKILKHYLGEQPNGNSYLRVVFDVDGTPMPCTIWLTEKALGFARAQIRALGFDIDVQDLNILDQDHTALAGQEVTVEVEENVYNGKTSMRCNILVEKRLSKEKASKLTQQLRAAKGNGSAGSGTAKPPVTKGKQTATVTKDEPIGDDIPF